MSLPKPPKMYARFIERYPKLSAAWDLINEESEAGPLDARTQRLVKLGISVGAQKTGAVHAGVRKALAQGIAREEIEQVVALAAGTIGLPSAVATYSWMLDVLEKDA